MLKAIQTTLKISDQLSHKLSAKIAMKAATFPGNAPRPEREKAQLVTATKGEYVGALGKKNPYWTWGEGPVVILCHGWAGRGSQLATLAIALAKAGYQAVIYDASSHGDSSGTFSTFNLMEKDILALSKQFEHIHAYVCHSMGGMSVMKARKAGLKADKFVIIASPYAPLPIVEVMQTTLKVPPKALAICKDRLADQFQSQWDSLLDGEIYRDIKQPALLIYDKVDRELPPNSMLHFNQVLAQCQQAETLVTEGLGHRKLLWSPEVIDQVIGFLNKASALVSNQELPS